MFNLEKKPEKINTQDEEGKTALHIAAHLGHYDIGFFSFLLFFQNFTLN